jgi:hypothetical protein
MVRGLEAAIWFTGSPLRLLSMVTITTMVMLVMLVMLVMASVIRHGVTA